MHQLSTLIKKIIIVTLLIIICTNVYANNTPTLKFYVNDFANVLSESTEQYIVNVNTSLESQTGAQIVVVTTQNLQGQTLEEYATHLFRSYGIGDQTKNNGVLLLLAYEERQFRIEVGYGLEGALNDGKTGEIQDLYIVPYLKEENWVAGIKNGFDAVVQQVCKEYQITVTSDKPVDLYGVTIDISDLKKHSWLASFGLILGSVFGICSKLKRLSGKKAFAYTILGWLVSIGISWIIVKNTIIVIPIAIINLIGAIFIFIILNSQRGIRIGRGIYRGMHSSNESINNDGIDRHYTGGGGRSGGGGSSRGF